jgi:hypothetical protein
MTVDRGGWGVKLWAGFVLTALVACYGWLIWQCAQMVWRAWSGGGA